MHIRKPKQGIVFITSMIALVVMLIVGTSFIGLASQQLNSAQRDLELLHATALADGGLNYAIAMQKNPATQTNTIYTTAQMPTDLQNLHPDGAIVPQFTTPSDAIDAGDKFAVWLSEFRIDGNLVGYQAVSRGQSRQYTRLVRAVLQGQIPGNTELSAPPQLVYSVFAKSDVTMGNSSEVKGNLGSNGSIGLDLSSGKVMGNLYTAGSIKVKNLNGSIMPEVTFGTKVYETNGNDNKETDITSTAATFFANSTVHSDGKTLVVPTITVEDYKKWADRFGSTAYWNDSSISSAGSIRTPILYIPKTSLANNKPIFHINTDILGYNPTGTTKTDPLTIFVDGNVSIEGNTTLGIAPEEFTDANHNGTYDAGETSTDVNENGVLDTAEVYVDSNKNGVYDAGIPVTLIATGTIALKGTSNINGIVWAEGAFGGGTPTVKGSIICDNVNYQGNCFFFHYSFSNAQVVPPAVTDEMWRVASWEIM